MRPLSLALVLSAVVTLSSATDARATFVVTVNGSIDGVNGTANFDGGGANGYPVESLYTVAFDDTVTVTGYVDLFGGATGGTVAVSPNMTSALLFNGESIAANIKNTTPKLVTVGAGETVRFEYTFTYLLRQIIGVDPTELARTDTRQPFVLSGLYVDRTTVDPFSTGVTVSGRGFSDAHSDVVVTYTYMPAPQGAALLLGALPFAVAFRRRLFSPRPASVQG